MRAVSAASVCLALGACLLALPVVRHVPQSIPQPLPPVKSSAAQPATDGPRGLVFRLSGVDAHEPATANPTQDTGTPLDETSSQALFSKLAPLPASSSDSRSFEFPPSTLKPPLAGRSIEEQFQPGESRNAPGSPAAAPLSVLRRAPEGDVPSADRVIVSFSQAMVALGANENLALSEVPVKLKPQPAGTWHWLDVRTLLFQPKGTMPMATDFVAEIARGTTSSSGATMTNTERWSFSTAAAAPADWDPGNNDTAGLNPVMFISFDQPIDRNAAFSAIRVRAGDKPIAVHLVSRDEALKDSRAAVRLRKLPDANWIAFRADAPLPAASTITVAVSPNAFSAQGPKASHAMTWSFKTYAAMRLVETNCSWRTPCQPGSFWKLRFSNAIDDANFAARMVRVEPPIKDMTVNVVDDAIAVGGGTRGATTYRVTIEGHLRDEFGQALGRDETVTFTVRSAQPMVRAGTYQDRVVLDASSRPHLPIYSRGCESLGVEVYSVSPADWNDYISSYMDRRIFFTKRSPKLLRSWKEMVKGSPQELTATTLDLAPALPSGVGQLLLVVAPNGLPAVPQDDKRWWRGNASRLALWVQVTKIGLTVAADRNTLLAWTSSLADGRPLAGVDLSLVPGKGPVSVTGPDGTSRIQTRDLEAKQLVARLGADVAFLPIDPGLVRASSGNRERLAWHVFDDRGLYRPGDDVHVKGWLRVEEPGPSGDLRMPGNAIRNVTWRLVDGGSRSGVEVARGSAPVNRFAGFSFAVQLPLGMNVGNALLQLQSDSKRFQDDGFVHFVGVQEFRRPEFEVHTSADGAPHIVRGHAVVSAAVSYFGGGPLPSAPVKWEVTSSPTSFTPGNRDDYTFGSGSAGWWMRSLDGLEDEHEQFTQATRSATTDAAGKDRLRIDFDSVNPPRPTSVYVVATVSDVNRQTISSDVGLLVHPSSVYVGLKTDRYFVHGGEPLRIDVLVTDIDGTAVGGRPVTVRAERLGWKRRGGEWVAERLDKQEQRITSASEPSRCTFNAPVGGEYLITARVADAEGRPNETEIRRWVEGGLTPRDMTFEGEELTLVRDRDEYHPGNTAEIALAVPFAPAEGLMTVRREGIARTERFKVTSTSCVLRVPIEEAWNSDVWVRVDLAGAMDRRPAFATGATYLPIRPQSRRLGVSVTPRAQLLQPGAATTIDLSVRDATGRPAADAEAAVIVVDEAILSLSDYKLSDPLASFYTERPLAVYDANLRSMLLLPFNQRGDVRDKNAEFGVAGGIVGGIVGGLPSAPAEGISGGLQGVPAPPPPPPPSPPPSSLADAVRSNFAALALFAESVTTDKAGQASVRVTLPHTLTRYRVMVVAADDVRFGTAESTITARLPLMLRPSAPRFLNVGDRFELPVVVQNQTDAAVSIDVAVRASNARIDAPSGRRLTIPANDRRELRFPVNAEHAGTARFQFAAASANAGDASEVSVPVYTPIAPETFATYGQVDSGSVRHSLVSPRNVVPQFGGLEISTSSTALQALTDAVLYLVDYPFECAEQISSRVMAIAALGDVLSAFHVPGLPDRASIKSAIARDLSRLADLQRHDGGFGLWERDEKTEFPYASVHAAHSLERARLAGLDVPGPVIAKARGYLRDIDRHVPKSYSSSARTSLVAYALYVRSLGGDRDAARARQLVLQAGGVPKLSFEAIGWLLTVMSEDPACAETVASIRQHLNNHVAETAAAAHFQVSYKDGYVLFDCERRADAVLLDALITDQPQSYLIPKLVEGLLAHRSSGRWESTQENAFVLLALDRYFRTYEKATPDFVARVWLGDRYAGEHSYRGRTTDRNVIGVGMSTLAAFGDRQDVVLSKEGPGRLYYRLGLKYARRDPNLLPLDRGFSVQRIYEAVDDPEDVRQEADGTWHVKAGARVRVRVQVDANATRHHVALVDPLPAGLEILNAALKTVADVPTDEKKPAHWYEAHWFEHENPRDNRAEVFTTNLTAGAHSFSYVCRATVPGLFIAPPPRAEEMYHPETFGRGATDRLVVEQR